jgi:xanthine dehydrogenase large subunit
MRLGDAQRRHRRRAAQAPATWTIGGQEHFYLEGQVALVIPGEAGDLHVWSSTQHPTETQHVIARCLGCRDNAITVEVRRMGGGFGGKETQSVQWAAMAALAALKTRPAGQDPPRPRRRHRDDRQAARLRDRLDVGFDDEGRLRGAAFELASRCGHSTDLSRGRSTTGRCSTPTTPMPCRPPRSSRTASAPTRSPTPPSAASAGRRG